MMSDIDSPRLINLEKYQHNKPNSAYIASNNGNRQKINIKAKIDLNMIISPERKTYDELSIH